jgi:hypothetical protein
MHPELSKNPNVTEDIERVEESKNEAGRTDM